MKNHLIKTGAILLAAAFLLPLSSCAGTETPTEAETSAEQTAGETTAEQTTGEATEAPPEPEKITPGEGETVSLLNAEMTAWLSKYKKSRLDKICDFTEKCAPVPVSFYWGGDYDYTNLFVSENADLSDPLVFLCSGKGAEIEELLPGTDYYWRTESYKGGEKTVSETHSFKTLQTPLTVLIPGISNVRDIGGKATFDGKRVKYGIAYRGADLSRLTDEGKRKAVDVLGIKTELDLRNKVNGTSPFGKEVKYVSVTAPYYVNVTEDSYKDDLVAEMRVFADPENFPVYYHCSLGRDRTGTLTLFLLGLLGVSDNDIYMDYEISFFSDCNGYIEASPPAPSLMTSQLTSLRSMLAPGKKPLYDGVRAFLKELGMTDEELDAIRANMLEDVK